MEVAVSTKTGAGVSLEHQNSKGPNVSIYRGLRVPIYGIINVALVKYTLFLCLDPAESSCYCSALRSKAFGLPGIMIKWNPHH